MNREEAEIKNIVRIEVLKHHRNLDKHHVESIVDAMYKQLTEYFSLDDLSKMVHSLRYEFINIVNELIPVVEEYEERIEDELDKYVDKLINPPV